MIPQIQSRWKRTGRIEKLFAAVLLLYFAVAIARPSSAFVPLLQIVVAFLAAWIVVRLTGRLMRRALWRLRNRLLMTYLFIAAVPLLLTLTLLAAGVYYFSRQLAVYMITSELDRRVKTLDWLAKSIADAEEPERRSLAGHMVEAIQPQFQNAVILVRSRGQVERWPREERMDAPAAGWGAASGMVFDDGRFYAWSHVVESSVDVTVAVPLTRAYLTSLVPELGDVALFILRDPSRQQNPQQVPEAPTHTLGPAVNWADIDFFASSPLLAFAFWDEPNKTATRGLISIHTRLSTLLGTIINTEIGLQQFWLITLLGLAILFAILEAVSIARGIILARTITGAVHGLYEGTQRVMKGDFSHRIQVTETRDQLAELGGSFNMMTANIERLLAVAKEKERLQTEIEIAREVQEQLYPKVVPELPTLRLTATCVPARMVSGDYYDFQYLSDGRLALAMGDVAGKGISAALLMATIQSATRMELRAALEAAAPGAQAVKRLSAAQVVSDLNVQLHATTAPEKFATFCFGVYDEGSSSFTYTNAGHLPPALIRNGSVKRLEVNGMVVGAFPFAQYGESMVELEKGDLLVFFTDGVTEPENEYGEMFGEERLISLIAKHASRSDTEILTLAIDAVRNWTNSPELQDDMTLLVARRL